MQNQYDATFVVGLVGDRSHEDKHLPRELFKELLGYLIHAWADKGGEQQGQQE